MHACFLSHSLVLSHSLTRARARALSLCAHPNLVHAACLCASVSVSVWMPVFSLILSFSLSLARARALSLFVRAHPKMRTKDGKTVEEVALEEKADAAFLGFLRDSVRRQSVQELVSAARDGNWEDFHVLRAGVVTADLNTVPKGRIWGVIHQVERERAPE